MQILTSLLMPGTTQSVSLGDDFVALPANRLNSKVYSFADGKEARSQFTGLRDFGPLTPLESPAKLLFVFREQERVVARKLALALRGSAQRERFGFPGHKQPREKRPPPPQLETSTAMASLTQYSQTMQTAASQ